MTEKLIYGTGRAGRFHFTYYIRDLLVRRRFVIEGDLRRRETRNPVRNGKYLIIIIIIIRESFFEIVEADWSVEGRESFSFVLKDILNVPPKVANTLSYTSYHKGDKSISILRVLRLVMQNMVLHLVEDESHWSWIWSDRPWAYEVSIINSLWCIHYIHLPSFRNILSGMKLFRKSKGWDKMKQIRNDWRCSKRKLPRSDKHDN